MAHKIKDLRKGFSDHHDFAVVIPFKSKKSCKSWMKDYNLTAWNYAVIKTLDIKGSK